MCMCESLLLVTCTYQANKASEGDRTPDRQLQFRYSPRLQVQGHTGRAYRWDLKPTCTFPPDKNPRSVGRLLWIPDGISQVGELHSCHGQRHRRQQHYGWIEREISSALPVELLRRSQIAPAPLLPLPCGVNGCYAGEN